MADTFQTPDSVASAGSLASLLPSLTLQLTQLLIATSTMLGLSIYEVASHFPFDVHLFLDVRHRRSKVGPQTMCYFISRYFILARLALEVDAVMRLSIGDFAHSTIMPAKTWTLAILGALAMASSSTILFLRIPALFSRSTWSFALVMLLGAGQLTSGLLWGSNDSPELGIQSSALIASGQSWSISSLLTIRYWYALGIDVLTSAFVIASLRRRSNGFLRNGIASLLFTDALFYLTASIVVNTTAGVITLRFPSNVFAILGCVDITGCLVSIMACHIFRAQYRFLHRDGTIIMSDTAIGEEPISTGRPQWLKGFWQARRRNSTIELAQTTSDPRTSDVRGSLKNMSSHSRMLPQDAADDFEPAIGVRSYTGESVANRLSYRRRDSDANMRTNAIQSIETFSNPGSRSDGTCPSPEYPTSPYTPSPYTPVHSLLSPSKSNPHLPTFSPPMSPVATPPSALHRRSNSTTKRGWNFADRQSSLRSARQKGPPHTPTSTTQRGVRSHDGEESAQATVSPLFAPVRNGNRELPSLPRTDITPFLASQTRSQQAQLSARPHSDLWTNTRSPPSPASWKLVTPGELPPVGDGPTRHESISAASSDSEYGDWTSPSRRREGRAIRLRRRKPRNGQQGVLGLDVGETAMSDSSEENVQVGATTGPTSGGSAPSLPEPHPAASHPTPITAQIRRRLSSPLGWSQFSADLTSSALTPSSLSHDNGGIGAYTAAPGTHASPPLSSAHGLPLEDLDEHPPASQTAYSDWIAGLEGYPPSIPDADLTEWTRREHQRRASLWAENEDSGEQATQEEAPMETLAAALHPLHLSRAGDSVHSVHSVLSPTGIEGEDDVRPSDHHGSHLSAASCSDLASAFGVPRSSPRRRASGSRSSSDTGAEVDSCSERPVVLLHHTVRAGGCVGTGEAGGIEAPHRFASASSHLHLAHPLTPPIDDVLAMAHPPAGRPPPPRRRTRSTVTSPSLISPQRTGQSAGSNALRGGMSLPDTSALGLPMRDEEASHEEPATVQSPTDDT